MERGDREARGEPREGGLAVAKRKMLSRRWTWSTKSYVAAKLSNRSENYLVSWKSLLRKYLENGWDRNQRK